jgi:membrane associated rhomboid family serine protease
MSGLANVPVTKGLLLLLGCNTLSSSIAGISNLQHLTLNAIFTTRQYWRLITSQLIFNNSTQLILGSIIIYNFRILERHLGSVKYCSIFVISTLASILAHIAIMTLFKTERVASGPLAFIHCLLVYNVLV